MMEINQKTQLPKIPEIPGYELISCCGSGAFGAVWICKSKYSDEKKAIKLMSKNVYQNLKLEKRGLAALKMVSTNENLIQIGPSGEAGGYFYYVTELADNLKEEGHGYIPDTLSNRIREGYSFSCDEIIEIISGILNGVQQMHRCRPALLHRDIKPDNIIFINKKPVVTDVGISNFVSTNLTINIGSQGYIPPEGWNKARLTGDIYSVGKILYTLINQLHVSKYPEISFDNKNLSSADYAFLNQIMLKATDKNHSKRYQSALIFKTAMLAKTRNAIVEKHLKRIFYIAVIAIACFAFMKIKENVQNYHNGILKVDDLIQSEKYNQAQNLLISINNEHLIYQMFFDVDAKFAEVAKYLEIEKQRKAGVNNYDLFDKNYPLTKNIKSYIIEKEAFKKRTDDKDKLLEKINLSLHNDINEADKLIKQFKVQFADYAKNKKFIILSELLKNKKNAKEKIEILENKVENLSGVISSNENNNKEYVKIKEKLDLEIKKFFIKINPDLKTLYELLKDKKRSQNDKIILGNIFLNNISNRIKKLNKLNQKNSSIIELKKILSKIKSLLSNKKDASPILKEYLNSL